jgi:hypothetical protein
MGQPQRAHASELMRSVHGLLQHKLNLLEGCRLRVQSMESRAQNAINLVSIGSTSFGNAEAQWNCRLSIPPTNKTVKY